MISRSLQKLSLFAAASGGIAVATLLDGRGLRRYQKLRDEVSSLRAHNAGLAKENGALAREVEALQHDPRYQVRVVHEELGFVRPGELLLELDESGPPAEGRLP